MANDTSTMSGIANCPKLAEAYAVEHVASINGLVRKAYVAGYRKGFDDGKATCRKASRERTVKVPNATTIVERTYDRDECERILEETGSVRIVNLFSERLAVRLWSSDITTMAALLRCTRSFLLNINRVGPGSVMAIENKVRLRGYELGCLPPMWFRVEYKAILSDGSSTKEFEADPEGIQKANTFVIEKNKELGV